MYTRKYAIVLGMFEIQFWGFGGDGYSILLVLIIDQSGGISHQPEWASADRGDVTIQSFWTVGECLVNGEWMNFSQFVEEHFM